MQKSNLGTLKDSHEFMEEKPQSTQDYHKVVKLLEKQVTPYLNVLLLTDCSSSFFFCTSLSRILNSEVKCSSLSMSKIAVYRIH